MAISDTFVKKLSCYGPGVTTRTAPQTTTREHTILIDTDPGQDDAVAIMLALASPADISVLGITAVAGNVPLALTLKNALSIVELCGNDDVPVYAGCDRPMTRPLITAEHVHGASGLNGSDLDEPTLQATPGHAVDFIIESLLSQPKSSVTVCTLGPLTNVATALQREPGISEHIKQIVMMGGGYFEQGNITPAAEFNIYVDPQAAALVFASGVPLVLMPLDVTHKALTSVERLQAFSDLGSRSGDCVAGMLNFFERFDVEKYGSAGGPLHDPTVIAYLLKPELFKGREVNVEIETESALTLGATVIDWWGVTDRKPNCLVMGDIDTTGFFKLLTDRISVLP